MTQEKIKALAYNNVKNSVEDIPQLNICEYVYYLGLLFTYRMAQTDESKAKAYMPTLDGLFKIELAKYPNWSTFYESNKITAERVEELNKLMLACCDNADNCECCRKIKEW